MQCDHYKICIDVPKKENICFIAMPFREDKVLDEVGDAIWKAADLIDIRPYRTDKKPKVDYVEDFWENLRSAKIVVAVISPDGETGVPNPNVMYELGIAHALGKATVILTTREEHIPSDVVTNTPSDVVTKYVEYYSAKDVEDSKSKENLIFRIKERMHHILDRMDKQSGRDLIDPKWKEKGVAVDPVTFCSDVNVRSNLKTIISFINDIQHHFPEVLGLLGHVKKGLGDICTTGIAEESTIETLDKDWSLANIKCNDIRNKFFIDYKERQESASAALNNLFNCATYAKDEDAEKAVEDAKGHYENITLKLDQYDNKYNAVAEDLKELGGFGSLLKNRNIDRLVDDMSRFHFIIETMIGRSYTMILNLIKMID
jgi:hypothetical protein